MHLKLMQNCVRWTESCLAEKHLVPKLNQTKTVLFEGNDVSNMALF